MGTFHLSQVWEMLLSHPGGGTDGYFRQLKKLLVVALQDNNEAAL